MESIKIFFSDFWSNFNPKNNLFYNLLSSKYNVIIDSVNPDLLFFSIFGDKHINFNCKKVFFTGENIAPDFFDYDFAMTFKYLENNKNHYRLPLYALFEDVYKLLEKPSPEEILKSKTEFCNFIYSNPICQKRNIFFKKLNNKKSVKAAGRVLNNTGWLVKDKLEYVRKFKFSIAFENENDIGYTTEKIFEPMLVNSVPVYWGNSRVNEDFNPKSFINADDFESLDELADYLVFLDENDDEYLKILSEPYFTNNEVNRFVKNENILQFLENIINSKQDLKIKRFFNQKGELSSISKILMKLHQYKILYGLKIKFFTIKKPIMRFKTKNLKFQ
jgi:hypothetical protein